MKIFYKYILVTSLLFFYEYSFGQEPEILNHSEQVAITELTTLNSDLQETNLSISPDGKFLFFMSDRGGQSWSIPYGTYHGQPRYDGDIWFSEKKDYVWQKPECIKTSVNTSGGEDEPIISPDGQFVVFQSWKSTWSVTGGPYYEAELSGRNWNIIGGVGGGVHNFFQEKSKGYRAYATDGAAISPNRRTFIVASGQFYEGNMDLYICRKTDKEWGKMKKMNVSTASNERSIFIAGDGKTIYFASNHYSNGFGGLDIYKATLLPNGDCVNIQNIGEPFNTEDDDYGFIVTSTGREAYFVRDGDIYFADLLNADNRIKPEPTKIISGVITNKKNKFVESYIELIHNDTVIAESKSNSLTGEFLFVVDAGYKELVIKDVEDKYINEEIITEKDGNTSVSIKAKTQETIWAVVNFDLNKAIIKAKGKSKLDSIVRVLSKSSAYTIALSGHTDSKGSDDYNTKLAKQRAKAVQQYLIKKGIKASQIKINGLVKKSSPSQNTSDAGAAKNRRTLLTIKAIF